MGLLLCLSTTVVAPAFGNIGGYSKGVQSTGAFKPFGIDQVEMLSEQLEIDLHMEHAEIRIDYVMHNPGPKVAVEAGFPCIVPISPLGMSRDLSAASLINLENFQLSADGEPIKTSLVEDDSRLSGYDLASRKAQGLGIKGWQVFTLDFKKGQTRRVTVKYRNPYAVQVMSGGAMGFSSSAPLLNYIFSSAAAWSGPIKQGSVVVRAVSVDPNRVELSHPARFKREDTRWTWLFTDLEPSLEDDLTIVASPGRNSPSTEGLTEAETGLPWKRTSYVHWAKGKFEGQERWELHFRDYAANATSSLPPEGLRNYSAENLADNENLTSWAEGAPGPGIGESVTLTLPKPAKIARMGLVNGYAATQELYEANNRVKRLNVRVNDGNAFSITVPDERLTTEHFYFDLPEPHNAVKSVTLTIAEVYKGAQFDDTCLSDVVLVTPLSKAPKLPPVR